VTLNSELQKDFLARGFSRRSFGRIAAMLTGASALPFFNEFSLAQEVDTHALPPGAVKIDSNENPLGPGDSATQAMQAMVPKGNRYQFNLPGEMAKAMADVEGLKADHITPYPGSSLPLHWAVLSYTSPTRPLVIADPGYEAAATAARFIGAKTIPVPLTKEFAHDVKAMVAADASPGLIYICNPNNPTGSLTSRESIDWIMANKPAGTMIMLDEAYIHFSGIQSAVDLVKADKDIIILRTFSKIYGMAGLRAGVAMARPDILRKMNQYGNTWMPVTSVAGVLASLKDTKLVPDRRKINADVREETLAFLSKHNFNYIPSVSNKFMVDTKRPARDVIAALRKENVYVGRVWPAVPTHIRVTVGTAEEMKKFQAAFIKVMA